MDEIIKIYQQIIRKRFPTVSVKMDQDIVGVLNALCIPDDEAGEYIDYMIKEASLELDRRGVLYVSVIPFTVSDTKRYCPEAWAELKDQVESILKDRASQQVLPPA